MHRALLELTVEGVETSRDFHLRVMEDDDFQAGRIEIQWLERRLPSLLGAKPPAAVERNAAIIAALIAERDRSSPRMTETGRGVSSKSTDRWTDVGRREGLR
jgi:acetyl-CoA carboxylase biotin carboxylase subunit